jgi:hypothetical protein
VKRHEDKAHEEGGRSGHSSLKCNLIQICILYIIIDRTVRRVSGTEVHPDTRGCAGIMEEETCGAGCDGDDAKCEGVVSFAKG